MENEEEYESEEESSDYFNDFSEQEQEYSQTTEAFQRELTETEKFKKDFDEELGLSDDPEAELANLAIEYIQASGDAAEVNQVNYSSRNAGAIDGWGFSGDEDQTNIDLFISFYRNPATDTRISRSDIEQNFSKMHRFFELSVEGRTPVGMEIARLIYDTRKIDRLRLFVMTNAIAPRDYAPDSSEMPSGTTVEYHIWDARRIMQQDDIMRGGEPVIIDFESDYNSPLPCVMMPDVSERVRCYLTIIPGTTLAQIYDRYHQQLLEHNVRTFLQLRVSSNKGIRDTLMGHRPNIAELRHGVLPRAPEPDMFFAYNNGLSTIASDVVIKKTNSGPVITRITDWQIVNGGQTTASISAVMRMHNADKAALSRVYVSMKVSVLKEKDDGIESYEDWDDIVGCISRYANTQSAVRMSDINFKINEPFLVELERLSRQKWVMSSENRPVFKWFFQRTLGQYLDMLHSCPTRSAYSEFMAEYPKSQMFDKRMLAKYMMAWSQDPASVCKGGEINYKKFYTRLHQEAYHFDERKYHYAIAKAVLFKTIDAYYGKDGIQLPGYKCSMVAYTLSTLSWLSGKKLDLDRIWREQCVLPASWMSELTIPMSAVYAKLVSGAEHITYNVKVSEGGRNHYEPHDIPEEELQKLRDTALYRVMQFVKTIEPTVWKVLVEDVDHGQNINEWTKSYRCWDTLRYTLAQTDMNFPQDLLSSSVDGDEEITDCQKRVIDEMKEIPSDVWFSINKWAKETMLFTPRETAFTGFIGYRIKRGLGVSYKQAKWAIDLLEKAKDKGWVSVSA